MSTIIEQIGKMGIIPVVVIDDIDTALPLAKALCEGGLPCAEVTFRTAAAKDAIKIMSDAYPEMLVGAGTVLTCKQVDEAVEAGAKFIVSPGLNPTVVSYCIEKGVPVVPGTCTPAEVESALSLGLDTVKFFPAEPTGGLGFIKAIAAPYTGVKFMPTGGINAENVKDYLAYDRILACGGTWMVKGDLLKKGDYDTICKLTKEAAEIVKSIRG